MGEVYEYDKSAPGNNSAPPNGWPENQAYNTVNNCAREMMAADARDLADRNGTLLTTGTAQAYSLTPNRSIGGLEDGMIFGFRCHFTNAQLPTTLNVGGTGAVSVLMADGSDPLLVTNGVYQVVYNGQTQRFQMLSATGGENAALTISVVSSNYTFSVADIDGEAIRIQATTSSANPLNVTLPVLFSNSQYEGKRLRILNPDNAYLQFVNNLSGSILRSDTSAGSIPSGGTGVGNDAAYTIILHNNAGLLLNSLA